MNRILPRTATLLVGTLLLVGACGDGDGGEPSSPAELAARGDELFHGEATCQTCHGADLEGTTMGPPLLHELYVPSHHPDEAIRSAVRNGVQSHHWDFGPMPALPHLGGDDIDAVIAYIRQEQEAAGITDG